MIHFLDDNKLISHRQSKQSNNVFTGSANKKWQLAAKMQQVPDP